MTSLPHSYRGYRFPPEIISHAVWLYHRFGLSFQDAEDLLAERGVTVTYEAIRQWSRSGCAARNGLCRLNCATGTSRRRDTAHQSSPRAAWGAWQLLALDHRRRRAHSPRGPVASRAVQDT